MTIQPPLTTCPTCGSTTWATADHPTTPRVDGELLPCPFCNASVHMSNEGQCHQVICQDCGSKAAEYPNPDLAALAWNTRPNPPSTGGDYSAWLIEINDSATDGPRYFHFEFDDDWTKDHDKATHFSRKIDAERVIEHYGWTRAKPVEHMWPAPKSQPSTGGALITDDILDAINDRSPRARTIVESVSMKFDIRRHAATPPALDRDTVEAAAIRALTGQPARSRNDEAGPSTQAVAVVPVEMTEEMMSAVRLEIEGDASALYRSEPHSIRLFYAAALRAAPSTNAQEPARSVEGAVADPLADLVARFSNALLKKLRLGQANGRSGWDRDDWEADCRRGLLRHMAKGDPRDVAAYCAFMWHHGWATAAPPDPAVRRWKHKVRGSTYRVLYEAAKASSVIAALDDMTMVVYQCETDGLIWVRPALEFFDGRFEALPPDAGDPK